MRRVFSLLFFGLLLFTEAAIADTPLETFYTYDGTPVAGEHVNGEIIAMLEIPEALASATGAAYETLLMDFGQTVAKSIGACAVQTYSAIAAATGRNIVYMKGDGKSTEELLAALSGKPGVIGASPNYISHAMKIPNDPGYEDLWGMWEINTGDAWDFATGSREVIVAVVDTGIDRNHPDLAANVARDKDGQWGFNAINNSSDPMDDHGHGTHVAGTIGAAGNNGVGVTGVNWEVGLLGIKVLNAMGSGSLNQIIAGLNYVRDQKNRGLNVRVVNMSLGGWRPPISNPSTDPYGSVIKALADAGILLVFAAGNEYQDIDNPGGWGSNPKAPFESYQGKLPYPACFRFTNTITVAAMDPNNTRSEFSNYSPNYVDLAAPGRDILSTVPGNDYKKFAGTSMATPHVAGAAALIAAAHPKESAAHIKARILNNVTSNPNFSGLVAKNGHLNLNGAIRGATPAPAPEPTPPPPPTPEPYVPVTGITISPAPLSLAVGQEADMTAALTPSNATNRVVTWYTSDRDVVYGTAYGLTATVTGLADGTAVITVITQDGGFSATCSVTVGSGGDGGGGGGCSVGAGSALPLALLLLAPLAVMLRRKK